MVVGNGRCPAVNRANRSTDFGSIGGPDALVTQADAKDRNPGTELPDDIDRDPGFRRRAWAGRKNDVCGRKAVDLVQQWTIVASDERLKAELATVARQVV